MLKMFYSVQTRKGPKSERKKKERKNIHFLKEKRNISSFLQNLSTFLVPISLLFSTYWKGSLKNPMFFLFIQSSHHLFNRFFFLQAEYPVIRHMKPDTRPDTGYKKSGYPVQPYSKYHVKRPKLNGKNFPAAPLLHCLRTFFSVDKILNNVSAASIDHPPSNAGQNVLDRRRSLYTRQNFLRGFSERVRLRCSLRSPWTANHYVSMVHFLLLKDSFFLVRQLFVEKPIPCTSRCFPIFKVFIDWRSSYHVLKILPKIFLDWKTMTLKNWT